MSDPGPSSNPLPHGVAAHGFGYLGGFVGAGTPRACPSPLNVFTLIDLAAENGLAGVEIPPEYIRDLSPEAQEKVGQGAQERHLFVVLACGPANASELAELIPAARRLGVRTIRVTASTILCGERRAVRDTWAEHISGIVRELRAFRGLAEEEGLTVAVENHQDLTSEELVELCSRVGGSNIGVTLDAVNPLAVVEDPLVFASRLGSLIKHVHLKDYQIFNTSQGFRLVRCAIGDGVLDVSGLLAILRDTSPGATTVIELAAEYGRHIQFLDPEYWTGFPPRTVERVIPVLRLRDEVGRSRSEDWRTPWEKEAPQEEVAEYEMRQFRESVEHLRRIAAEGAATQT